ncbi:MAG: hypothetical protein AB7O62_15845 [Pirellulales bacterium]
MTKISLNRVASEALSNLTKPVQLCDADGIVLGQFIPAASRGDIIDPEPKVSFEELADRAASSKWFSTQEVLAYLRQ